MSRISGAGVTHGAMPICTQQSAAPDPPMAVGLSTTTRITPETSKLDALLTYAGIGWKPFLLSSGKVPVKNCAWCDEHHVTNEQRESCGHVTCHGFYAATSAPDRLREMARLVPNGLVAIRTGQASGIVVLDIDTLDAHGVDGHATAERARQAGVLPTTSMQSTPSGGEHLVYAHPGGRIKGGSNKLGPGLDVKAEGGYFVAAPSISRKHGKPYRWAEDTVSLPLPPLHPRIAAYLRERPVPTQIRKTPDVPQLRDRYVNAAVAGEVQAILDSPKGGKGLLGRNDQLNRSAFILGTLVGAGVLDECDAENALTQAAYSVGLDRDTNSNPRVIAATIRSGMAAGMRNPRRLQGVR